jgi:hypothetical protein
MPWLDRRHTHRHFAAKHTFADRRRKTISGLTTTSSRCWAELTYMGHTTLALTLARSKRGRGALLALPRRGAYPRRPRVGCAPRSVPELSHTRPRSSGG